MMSIVRMQCRIFHLAIQYIGQINGTFHVAISIFDKLMLNLGSVELKTQMWTI